VVASTVRIVKISLPPEAARNRPEQRRTVIADALETPLAELVASL